eukprot:TRINITY_DN5762_c0_g1_i5.p1 TRINITY_DN5762_c0_g1~~TRINITY_DN5762_c0_g1_i5.p1  ORF type:complete len:621 (+),score=99.24 TRINITY_DN5762_c0_g1_i5:29-1891(+)
MNDKKGSKLKRKQNKALKIVKKDFDINICDPGQSRHILICNGGLTTGVSRELLLDVLSPFGPVEKISLIPGKSFSFSSFTTSSDAQNAICTINSSEPEHGLILVGIDKVPEENDELFDETLPPGCKLLKEFLTDEQEKKLLGYFLDEVSKVDRKDALKNRQVKHYGYEFNYETNDIDADKPLPEKIPDACQHLMDALLQQGHIPETGDQMTVNVYQPGHGIPPHTDSHSCCTDWLCSVSLGSGVLMEFKNTKGQTCPVWLPSRSALVLKDEARYIWKHGITPRQSDVVPNYITHQPTSKDEEESNQNKNTTLTPESKQDLNNTEREKRGLTLVNRELRISLTFRKATNKVCACQFPEFCDDKRRRSCNVLEESASVIEQKMVHMVYEEIASHFSETRHKPWPQVVHFIQDLPSNGVLVDVGCGNGKYLNTRSDLVVLGTDMSQNLLKIVRQRGFPAVRCDMLSLGLRDSLADGIVCIAVLHHLTTEQRRISAIQEMARVLKPGGKLLIYVWARDQKKDVEISSYLKQNKKNMRSVDTDENCENGEFGLPIHQNRTNFLHQDVLVPWKLKSTDHQSEAKTFKRYYHVFEEGELERLIVKGGLQHIVESYYDQGNWCAIAQK